MYNRVKETSTTTGTGNFTLSGSPEDTFFGFAAATLGSLKFCYVIKHLTQDEVEVGIGTYSSNTLTRSQVINSSNSDNKVNFSAGTKEVFITNPANVLNLGRDDASVTISGGTLTLGQDTFSKVAVETGTIDQVTTISGTHITNQLFYLANANNAHVIELLTSGNIKTPTGEAIAIPQDGVVVLRYDGTNYIVISVNDYLAIDTTTLHRVSPDIKGSNVFFFKDGESYSADDYRITYIGGTNRIKADALSKHVVAIGNAKYIVVYDNGDEETDMPQNSGYFDTPLGAKVDYKAQSNGRVDFTTTVAGPIGIYFEDQDYYIDNILGSPKPIFTLEVVS